MTKQCVRGCYRTVRRGGPVGTLNADGSLSKLIVSVPSGSEWLPAASRKIKNLRL
jgi:hypothetical protein